MAVDSVASAALQEPAAAHQQGSLLSVIGDWIYKVEHMPPVVGITWLVSSAIFTTYATNAFLGYKADPVMTSQRTMRRGEKPRSPWLSVPAHKWSVTRPTLLTLFRFAGSLLLGLLAHADLKLWDRIVQTAQASSAFLFPAICLFTANFSNAIALNRIGISLTYTSKCAIPLITVLLALCIDGPTALPHGLALASLLPIAMGIGAASWHAPTFETVGFTAAMLSATAQSTLNVVSKRAMVKTGVRGVEAQRVLVAVGLVIAAAVTAWESKSHFVEHKEERENEPFSIYVAAVTAYHIEYVLSFMFVKLVSPVTYGACDSIRRLSIILAGRAMFGGKPLTTVNKAGIGLALLGALGYSVATSATS